MPIQTKVAGVAFSTPAGGRVAIPPDGDVAVPERIHQLPNGVAFGPLALRPSGDGSVGIGHLAFPLWNADGASSASTDRVAGLAGGGLATTAVASEQSGGDAAAVIDDVGRRGFLAGAGIALCGAVLGAHTLDVEGTARPHLETEFVENPDGVTIDLVEALDGPVVSHEVRLDGSPIDHLTTGRRGFLAGAGLALGGAIIGAEALDAGDARLHLELDLVERPCSSAALARFSRSWSVYGAYSPRNST